MKLLLENWRKYTNLINEEQLLIEGRIDNVKKKYPELDKKGLLDVLIEKDPSGNQKYLMPAAFILDQEIKRYIEGGSKDVGKLEDMPTLTSPTQREEQFSSEGLAMKVATAVEKYHMYHKYIRNQDAPFKDFGRIKNLEALSAVVHYAEREKKLRDEEREVEKKRRHHAMQSSNLGVYSDENFMMNRPLDSESACYWGKKGNPWCVAQRGGTYFDSYTGQGQSFFFLEMNAKNEKKFAPEDWPQYRRLVVQFERDSYETTWDGNNETMEEHEVEDVIATNIFGQAFVAAYKEAADWGFVLTDDDPEDPGFNDEHPEHYDTIIATLEERGMDPDDDLEEFWNDEVRDTWYTIRNNAEYDVEQTPAGPTEEQFEAIEREADLQHVYISRDSDDGMHYWSGGMGFDFEDYDFGPPASPENLDQFDIEDEIRSILDDNYIWPDYFEIYDNDVRIDIQPDHDEQSGIDGFRRFVNSMSEHDSKYDDIKAELIEMFIDQEILDISDEPVGQLKAKLAEKELKHFNVESKGRTIQVATTEGLEYTDAGIKDGVKDIIELMGFWELVGPAIKRGATNLAAGRIAAWGSDITRYIVYFFKQSFKGEGERSHADNLLFDKMDALIGQAYAEAERQLTIPGIEAPEVKRIIPPTAVKFNPHSVYVESMHEKEKIKLQLLIDADAELGKEQSEFIAEFIDFFDENFDVLHRIVGEVVDQLIKDAVVEALEKSKKDFPDRARALGVDESKKRKKGIRILLGNRR